MAIQRLGGTGDGTRPAGTHSGVRSDRAQRTETAGRPVMGLYSSEGDDVLADIVPVAAEPEAPSAIQLAARKELAKRAKAARK